MSKQTQTFNGGTPGTGQANEMSTVNSGYTAVTNTNSIACIPFLFTTVGSRVACTQTLAGETLTGSARMANLEVATKMKEVIRFSLDDSDGDGNALTFHRGSYGTAVGGDTGTSYVAIITSAGQLQITRTGTGTGAVVFTSTMATGALPAATLIRFECYVEADGATAGNGKLHTALYVGESNTPIPGSDSGVLTGLNLTGAGGGFTQGRVGKLDTLTHTNKITWYQHDQNTEADAVDTPQGVAAAALSVTLAMSPTGNPSTAAVNVARTATATLTGGNSNAVALSLDWGDGGTADTASVTSPGTKTFTRTPTAAGPAANGYVKNATLTYSQPN